RDLIHVNGAIVTSCYSSVGGRTYGLTLVLLTSNGQLDASFGSSGSAIDNMLGVAHTSIPFSNDAIAMAANGDILATGAALNAVSGNLDFGVAAFLPGGALDTTFG